MNNLLLFFSNFIKNPAEVGAVAPSSGFLTKQIVKSIDFDSSKDIVELGPGLGTFTKEIIKKSRPDARIFCFETNRGFCKYLNRNIGVKKLTVINNGADKIYSSLRKISIPKVDCVVSGLPFRNFSLQKKIKIIREVKNSLKYNGRFVLFQYTNSIEKLLHSAFKNVTRKFVPINLPPAFVYVCEK